ncbi:hypothetical protein WJU23_15380 [Prosthecobacter sp. SYSU 5D2]|uniref:hypothetical protein n=1 Tax=Prosthecobacter sp. SYSU 5D2 TaxID=3134134 RepID=UPI0031FEED86
MNRPPRWLFLVPGLIAIVWLGWWLFGQSAEKQVRSAQGKFLVAVEKRNWKKVQSFLADDYSDSYGLNRETAPGTAAEVLKGFLFLTLETSVLPFQPSPSPPAAQVQVRIRMDGRGLGLSPIVMDRVNALQQPWLFHWRKDGPWHWDWKLTRIHHPELQVQSFQ